MFEQTMYLAVFFEISHAILVALGAIIVAYGALYAVWHLIKEIVGMGNTKKTAGLNIDHIRLEFGRNLILALEFFIAADVLQTVLVPDYFSVGLLGCLVIIRTLLSYFLNRELMQLQPTERQRLR